MIIKSRRKYTTIYNYITSEFFFIFFVNQLLLMAEEILSKKVPVKYVLLLLIYAMPSILSLSFPFATLVGALMAFGRFSTDNEIIALKTSGVSQHRIFLPLVE